MSLRKQPVCGADPSTVLREAVPARWHELLPHTADVGFRAVAPDLPALFEEAAHALEELTVGPPGGPGPSGWERVDLESRDLPGLAFAWLSELVSLADSERAAIVAAIVDRLQPADVASDGRTGVGPWRLSARLGLRPFDADGPRPLRQVKSATYHGLTVERTAGGWALRAFLDV